MSQPESSLHFTSLYTTVWSDAEMVTHLPFEAAFAEACNNGSLPGVILAATNKTRKHDNMVLIRCKVYL